MCKKSVDLKKLPSTKKKRVPLTFPCLLLQHNTYHSVGRSLAGCWVRMGSTAPLPSFSQWYTICITAIFQTSLLPPLSFFKNFFPGILSWAVSLEQLTLIYFSANSPALLCLHIFRHFFLLKLPVLGEQLIADLVFSVQKHLMLSGLTKGKVCGLFSSQISPYGSPLAKFPRRQRT